MDEPDNLFHLRKVDFLNCVSDGVVVRVQAGVEEESRDTVLKERPLVAPAQEIGATCVFVPSCLCGSILSA